MNYHFTFQNPNTHLLTIEATFQAEIAGSQIYLPNWRPGRYQIQNFAKRIKTIMAFDENRNRLEIQKSTKSSWKIANQPGQVTVVYEYYAFEMDAGNSWLDDEQLYINFINCCIYTQSSLSKPSTLNFDLPEGYEIATGLPKEGKHALKADSFYRLVDSPMFASASLRQITYSVKDYHFHLWIQGNLPKTDEEVIHDFRRFTETQVEVMGGFPCPEYHFLFQCLPYKHYHGVEHWNSTVITFGPSASLTERVDYKNFLGVSSHELFHTWNVIRIRPKEMSPYRFQEENYHHTGFVTEGVTSYYGDLFLVRSGVFSLDDYLIELNKLLKRHYENEGRHGLSVADSSFDLWLDGYEKGIPGRKVSIYNEGALAALILDLMLRDKFENRKSLDDVMRLMWSNHGMSDNGYTYQDYKTAAESIFEERLDEYFSDIISGNKPYEHYLAELLPKFGLDFKLVKSEKTEERVFGFRLQQQTIVDIAHGSSAEEKLSLGDKVELVNGQPFEDGNIPDNALHLQIDRFGRSLEVNLEPSLKGYFSVYQSSKSKRTGLKLHLLEGWLGKV